MSCRAAGGRTTNSTELKRAKRALRREVLAKRDRLPAEERGRRSAAIAVHLASLPEAAGVAVVLAYWAFGSEVDLSPFIEGLSNAIVGLPRVVGPNLVPVSYRLGDPMERTALGPEEPILGEPIEPTSIDLVLVPGVAFDRSGGRLGYGGGYYDRFFATIGEDIPRVGVAFSDQLVDSVPRGNSDRSVSLIVTEGGVIRPS